MLRLYGVWFLLPECGSLVEQGAETVQERLDLMLEHRDILRQRIEDLQLSLAATEFKIAMYQKGSRP